MAWCGGLRADHGQKHDPGDEISFRGDLTNEGPLQKALPVTESVALQPASSRQARALICMRLNACNHVLKTLAAYDDL
jgi:hypothetical protein